MLEIIKRMAASVLAVLHMRAELLAVEIEEEVLRLFSYLILSLIALVCFSVAALLAILLVIVAFWDSYRMTAIFCLMGAFGVGAFMIGRHVRRAFSTRPKFLSATLGEFAKDIEMVKPIRSANQEPPL